MQGDENTHVDSLGLFLTGATSDGGVQADPDLSFGNYRSSSRLEQIGFQIANPIHGIVIERLGGGNGYGLGSLEAVAGGAALRWTSPEEEPGEPVEIANGQTKMLESGGDYRKFIVVSRNTALPLKGTATVLLIPVYNDVIASSNVSDGERVAGEVKLRCIALKSLHAQYSIMNLKVWVGTLGNQQISDAGQLPGAGAGTLATTGTFTDWPDSGFCRITTAAGTLREIVYYSSRTATVLTVPAAGRGLLETAAAAGAASDKLDAVPGVKIAKEAPAGGHFSVAANENDTSAVSGLDWSTGITGDTGIVCGSLAMNEIVGIWLWLLVVAGQSASPKFENIIKWEFGIFDTWTL